MQRFRTRRPRPVRAFSMVVVAVVLAVLMPPHAAVPAQETQSFLEEIGSLDRFGSDAKAALGAELVGKHENPSVGPNGTMGTAIIIPEARQLWQIYAHPEGEIKTGVVVRNLDTLAIVRTLTFDARFDRATINSTQGGDWTHAVDATGSRLFLAGCTCLGGAGMEIYEIDLRTFDFKIRPLLGSLDQNTPNFGNTVLLGGITYDRYTDDLLVLYGGLAGAGATGNVNTFLYRLDLGEDEDFEITKLYRLRSCTAPVTSTDGAGDDNYDWEILVTEANLYVPCQRAGHTVIVVRMQRPPGGTDPDHVEDVVAGPVYGESVMADQLGGRLFVVTLLGQEIWAFEAATMSFVSVVATGPAGTKDPTGYGLDRATGRLFFQSPSFGLGVVEGRFFPIPQARTTSPRVKGQERILSDPVAGRVFVLEGHGVASVGEEGKARRYRIYRTDEAPVPPARPDPDANTADVPERDGVTEARWNASGSGYGTRVLWAKGYATVAPAPTVGVNAPTTALANAFRDRCGYTDRDLFAGRVIKAEYDTGSTAAAAVAMDVDGNTRQDLNDPARCQLDTLGGGRWPYEAASCASSEGNVPKEPSKGKPTDLGPSEVSCPAPGRLLEAWAAKQVSGDDLDVEVDRAWTRTVIERKNGVEVTVEAVAQGVSVRDVVHFGEIRSTATSASNGRPKRKDLSTHAIQISEVRMGERVLCRAVCGDDELAELETVLNTAAAGRAVFKTGKGPTSGRDEELLEGTPRGAQTAVQKSIARQASDRALLGDFTVEVPAFEITVFNDNPDNTGWGRARQVYQFAAVATAATYNVVLPPTGVPFDPDGGGLPDEPPLPDIGNTPFVGLTEEIESDPYRLDSAKSVAGQRDGDDDNNSGLLDGIGNVLKAVGRGIRLFLTSPRHALLLLTAWALLSSPAVLSRRRRLLVDVRSQ